MESLGNHSVNNIKNCSEDATEIDVHYKDSALSCSNLKSVQKPNELDICSFDHRNGSVDLHCKIQSTDDNVFNVEKSFVVNEQNDIESDRVNLSEDSTCSKNSHELNTAIVSQNNTGESLTDETLSLENDGESLSKNNILENQLTRDDSLFTCNIEVKDGESSVSGLTSSNLCLNDAAESNVNINDESLFEDVNKYNVTDGDSNESSLQDPLFIGDCLSVMYTAEYDKNDNQSQSCSENTEKACTEVDNLSKESSKIEDSANICTENVSLLNKSNVNVCMKDEPLLKESPQVENDETILIVDELSEENSRVENNENECNKEDLLSKENAQDENTANFCTDSDLLKENAQDENTAIFYMESEPLSKKNAQDENTAIFFTESEPLSKENAQDENTAICTESDFLKENAQDENSAKFFMEREPLSKETNDEIDNEINDLQGDSIITSVSQKVNLTDEEVNQEIEAILEPQSHNIVVGYGEDAILITNLSVPPPVQLIREKTKETMSPLDECSTSREETLVPAAKKLKLDSECQDFPSLDGNDGKPFLLKILPIKNGHGLWNIEELKMVLEDRGSILLRLCGAPEAGNEDIIDGPKADFTALLLDESIPVNDEHSNEGLDPEEDLTMNQSLLFDRLSDIDFSSLNEEYNPPFWKHQIVEPKMPSVPKRKRVSPKSQSTPQTPRGGRKRGRPPLHNRGWVPKMKFSSPSLPDEPIKFRPPTPPPTALAGGDGSSKSMGILEAVLSKTVSPNTRKSTPEPSPGENLSTKSVVDEEMMTVDEDDSMGAVSDEIDAIINRPIIPEGGRLIPVGGPKSKKFVIKIPCPHCHLLFRKKAALTGHIKIRHKMMRKCPICHESVKVKGKFGLKFHIAKVHKDEKNFTCDICQDSFQMLHYLKNHRRLMHSSVISTDDDDEEEGATDSEEVMSIAEEPEQFSTEKEVNVPEKKDRHTNTPEKEIKIKNTLEKVEKEAARSKRTPEKEINTSEMEAIITRTTRSGTVYEINREKEKMEVQQNTKKQANNVKVEEEEEDASSVKSIMIEPSRTLRSQSSTTTRVNKQKRTPVISKMKQSIKGGKQDEEILSSENGNESDDEEEPESDIEVVEDKKNTCDMCDESFSHLWKLQDHKRKKHSSRTSLRNKPIVLSGDELTCKICKKKCRTENQFKLHAAQHKPSNEKGRGTIATRGSVVSGRHSFEKDDSDVGEDFEEEEQSVSKSLSSFKGCEIPSYIVRKGKLYLCTKCNLNFKREKQMTYHLKKIHEALYPFRKCPDCPRVFRSSGPYIRHLREHRGRKCPVDGCKAKYKVLRLIKKHQRHAHPKLSHRCTRCVALFAKESDLELHNKEDHQENSRRDSKDGDEEEMDDEDDVEEEEEEEEEEDDEEEEEEEEENVKVEANKKGSKDYRNTPQKKMSSTEQKKSGYGEDSSHVRRTRTTNISYKEDEDDDDILQEKIPILSPMKKSISLPSRVVYCGSEIKQQELKKPTFIAQSNPLKNLREAIMMQNASKAKKQLEQQPQQKQQQQQQVQRTVEDTEQVQPYVKPKRRYVRKAPYKKRKVDTSWTAALKAQYEGFPPDSNDRKYVSMSTTPSLTTNPMYSPGITADVVRRVAESLLNKHQEQQQKQQLKLQKKQMKQLQQQNRRNASFISYNAKSKHLPRIAYSNLIGSRDNSLSSFDDSSHADGGDYYGNSSSSTSRTSKVVPDNDGSDKVLRFDSF